LVHGFSLKPQGFGSASDALQGLGLGGYPSAVPKQVHGTEILPVEEGRGTSHPVADGLIAKTPGIALVVKVADCVSLYLVDALTPAIGLVHVGWRGAAQGIVPKAVREMSQAFGTKARDLLAALGPAIQTCCYEVGEEVAERFPQSVRRRPGAAWHLDLPGAVYRELTESGVRAKNIHRSPHCTACERERFYSYRRDRGVAGRHYAILALRKGG
jgi:YfiH family protein